MVVLLQKKNKVSESYISGIKNKIKNLKYRPLIIDSEIHCLECKKPEKDLIFHVHSISKIPIAIVCKNCKKLIGDKSIFSTGKLSKVRYKENILPFNINEEDLVEIQITINNAEELTNFKKTPAENYNDIIGKLIQVGKWFKQEKNAYKRMQGPNISL